MYKEYVFPYVRMWLALGLSGGERASETWRREWKDWREVKEEGGG